MAKKTNQTNQTDSMAFPVVNPNAAGIDIGDLLIAVAVPQDRDNQPVREFGAFTEDLLSIARWLKRCHVDSVAMECTGVYWKNLYAVLIEQGFRVCLANSRHTKNVTGRKTDMSDAQWIQQLHSCGFLASAFLPDDATQTLRTLVRQRRAITQDSTRYIQRMQKALELMNIKLHAVISDITGKTGSAILSAIINGERDPEKLLLLVGDRIKADRDTLRKSLQANWREEYLFVLKQSYDTYLHLQSQKELYDQQIERVLDAFHKKMALHEIVPVDPVKKKAKKRKQPKADIRKYLHAILGVDVIDIPGISEIAALEIVSETGTDLSKWPSRNHFVSWLNLCPNNKISGGKLISSQVLKKKPNAAAVAFRTAANTMCRSKSWIGDYFRRMKAKGGQKYAIVASARKLAIIYYEMVFSGKQYKPLDNLEYKSIAQRKKIAHLEKLLERLKTEVA
jgi:transposase